MSKAEISLRIERIKEVELKKASYKKDKKGEGYLSFWLAMIEELIERKSEKKIEMKRMWIPQFKKVKV